MDPNLPPLKDERWIIDTHRELYDGMDNLLKVFDEEVKIHAHGLDRQLVLQFLSNSSAPKRSESKEAYRRHPYWTCLGCSCFPRTMLW